MRVLRLHLPRFKNLRDLSVELSSSEDISVIVGRNGAGKSNVLEALTLIFRDLDLGAQPSFAYEITYECRGKVIDIDADPTRPTGRVRVAVNGARTAAKDLTSVPGRPYLPSFVFGYYSGPSARLEEQFRTHQRNFSRDLRRGLDAPPRRLFYARPVHSQFALLSLYLLRNEEMLSFLREELWIEELESVLFVMRQPPWTGPPDGDERFWRASGTVSELLGHLYKLGLAPLRRTEHVPTELGSGAHLEHLYLFLDTPEKLQHLADSYGDERSFFKALESTYISELLREVRIRVRTRLADGAITFRELSEGEQQLLMVLGLLRFTNEEEALFLLDEPDTHLNPAWSQRYIDLLRSVGGMKGSSQIVMATHDPLVVSSLVKQQVRILSRDERTGRVEATEPDEHPRGMGVAGLLTSDVYGLRTQLDLHTLGVIEQQRALSAHASLTEAEQHRLDVLTNQVQSLGFTDVIRDPDYERFRQALGAWRRELGLAEKTVFTPEERGREAEAAQRILTRIKDDEET